jgi:hypothetical protein
MSGFVSFPFDMSNRKRLQPTETQLGIVNQMSIYIYIYICSNVYRQWIPFKNHIRKPHINIINTYIYIVGCFKTYCWVAQSFLCVCFFNFNSSLSPVPFCNLKKKKKIMMQDLFFSVHLDISFSHSQDQKTIGFTYWCCFCC